MVNLISEQYATLYFANKCSGAFVFCVTLYFFIIILPFLFGFTAGDFWIQNKTSFQTPKIISYNEYMLKILFSDGSQYIYSNVPEIQLTLGTYPIGQFSFSQTAVSINENDELQPKTSNFTTNFIIDLLSVAKVQQIREIQILLFYEYELDEIVSLKMQSYAFASLKSANGIQFGQTIGQLQFRQRHPIYAGNTPRTKYNYSAYYDPLGQILTDPLDIITNTFYYRNESMNYDYITYIIPPTNSTTISSTSQSVQSYLAYVMTPQTTVYINMTLQVPLQEPIMYQAQLIESLKFSWMQYFSIFLIFWFFGQFLLEFVMSNKVFSTHQIINVTNEQSTYSKMKLE